MNRAFMTVFLDVIAQNARVLKGLLPPDVKMMAVVKADAYGHGAVAVSRTLIHEGLADALAVATLREGVQLRENGVAGAPILLLGGAEAEDADEIIKNRLSVAVYEPEALQWLAQAARRAGEPAKAHIKLDTGMTRLGARYFDELEELLDAWETVPEVEMEGAFTHFCAVESDPAFTSAQNARFEEALKTIRARGFSPICHAAQSDAMLQPEYCHDMVRAGISLYGAGVKRLIGKIAPAQRLTSHPIRLTWIEEGETVGYERAFRAERETRVMTVPVGYGDGYPRILGGKADVIVNGRRARIIGNICMDMLMADVTDAGEIGENCEVVLLGAQGGERITPEELAEKAQTIPYEIMLGFSPRIERRYEGHTQA